MSSSSRNTESGDNAEIIYKTFENTCIGIALLDEAGNLIRSNQACLNIFGVPGTDQLRTYNLFRDPNLPADVGIRLPRGESTGYQTPFDFDRIKSCGLYQTSRYGTSYLDVSITPLIDAATGFLSGFLMQVQDISDHRKIEEHLASLTEELEIRVKRRTLDLEKLNLVLNDEIAQSRITREALRQSQSQLENLVNAMSEGVTLMDGTGNVIKANPAMCRILGRDLDSIEGHPYYELGRKLLRPDNTLLARENLPSTMVLNSRQSVRDFEIGLERDDGLLVWLRVNAVPLLDERGNLEGIVRTFYDITEQKRMQDNLKANEAHLRLMLNQLPCILWTTDEDLVYSLSLGAGLQIFNLYPNQIVGMSIFDYYNTSDPEFPAILAHRQAMSGQPACYELHWEEKTLSSYVEPLREANGQIIGVIGISFDITGKKQAEDALRSLSQRLVDVQENERRNIARELHDEIGQSLAALKFVLNQVSRSAAGIPLPSLNEAQTVVTELIRQVRDMSLKLRPSMLDDLGLLPTLLWYIENYAGQTHIKVGFEHSGLQRTFSPEINTAVYRIVQEALTNVSRHANTLDVNISIWADENKIALKIEDHGRGFTSSALHSSSSTGISNMRERVRLLEGELNIETVPGVGTCLEAEIPLKK
jgi:PAS domain S-box-containing protein